MSKIYIVGPVGSGKTTMAKELSKSCGIPFYDLDKIVYDDENHHKRTPIQIEKMMLSILQQKEWIVEDVGREVFLPILRKADVVYYLDKDRFTLYKRCFGRWIKQWIGLEEGSYKPTFSMFLDQIKWINKDFHNIEKKQRIQNNARRLVKLK